MGGIPPARHSVLFRLAQIALFGIVLLATLFGLFYAVENWRGDHALASYRAEMEREGEHIGWAGVIPPPVPDEHNLAMTPLLKPLLDYERVKGKVEWRSSSDEAKAFKLLQKGPKMPRPEKPEMMDLTAWASFFREANLAADADGKSAATNVLTGLSQFDAQFNELAEAVKARPEGRWPVRYEENFACLLPHLSVLKDIVLACNVRAAAHLENGNSAAAFDDIKVGLALSDSIRTDPILISHLVRAAMISFNVQGVREGLARRRWTDQQLVYFQDYFANMNLFKELKQCLRGERAFSSEAIEMARTKKFGPEFWGEPSASWAKAPWINLAPRGWFEQNILNILRFHDQYSLAVVDEAALRMKPVKAGEFERSLTNSITPYNVLSRILLPAVSALLPKTARSQSIAEQAAIACALERYYRGHQRYPEKLEQLTPDFMAAIPHDVMDGAPMRYRAENDGSYILYSIGWNRTDDGGVVARKPGKSQNLDIKDGDWPWRLFGSKAQDE